MNTLLAAATLCIAMITDENMGCYPTEPTNPEACAATQLYLEGSERWRINGTYAGGRGWTASRWATEIDGVSELVEGCPDGPDEPNAAFILLGNNNGWQTIYQDPPLPEFLVRTAAEYRQDLLDIKSELKLKWPQITDDKIFLSRPIWPFERFVGDWCGPELVACSWTGSECECAPEIVPLGCVPNPAVGACVCETRTCDFPFYAGRVREYMEVVSDLIVEGEFQPGIRSHWYRESNDDANYTHGSEGHHPIGPATDELKQGFEALFDDVTAVPEPDLALGLVVCWATLACAGGRRGNHGYGSRLRHSDRQDKGRAARAAEREDG